MNAVIVELTPTICVAFDVLAGKYGVNPERRERLKSAGYDPDKVQKCVNDLMKLMEEYK